MFVPITQEVSSAFGTPILKRAVGSATAINVGLERAILARAELGAPNRRISNAGGWQSLPDLLDWPEPEIKLLVQEADRSIQQICALPATLAHQPDPPRVRYDAYAWANINRPGDYNMLHLHPNNHWSVVYYVATGRLFPDTPINGRIELRDPRPAATFARMPGFNTGQPMLIRPQPGMMLVFPAWIEHSVHPFYGEGHRISIAINVAIARATS